MLLLAGCAASLEAAVDAAGLSRDAVVRLEPDLAVAARVEGSGVRVYRLVMQREGWTVEPWASTDTAPRSGSVHVATTSQHAPGDWHTVVYGSAGPGVSRVVLPETDGVGGQVVDGAWVVVARAPDVELGSVAWQFVDAVGEVVDEGHGPFPPLP